MNKHLARSLLIISLFGSAAQGQTTLYAPGGTVGNISGSNVGIGTSTPVYRLDVAGTINSNLGYCLITPQNTRTAIYMLQTQTGEAGFGMVSGDNTLYITNQTGSQPLGYAPQSMVLKYPTGNVGIGTATPGYKLDVAGTINSSTGYSLVTPQNSGASLYMLQTQTGESGFGMLPGDNTLYITNRTGSQPLGYAPQSIVIKYPTGNVGIGTSTPGATLEVHANASGSVGPVIRLQNDSGGVGAGGAVEFNSYAIGTTAPIARIQSSDDGNYSSNLLILTKAPGNSGMNPLTERVRIASNGYVGIGTTNPTYLLSVNGIIEAKEVIVQTNWSDYVFKPEYRLAPLSEVQQTIEKEGHLPGIPSAKEVAERGISVGEIQAKLLAKIEELTLHQIEQEKQLAAQQKQLEAQQTEIRTLKAKLSAGL